MAEGNSIYADVSTFPKASATPYDPLGTIGKLQGIEQQRIGIDQSKLKLVNDKWQFASRVLGGLLNKPDLTGKDRQDAYEYLHKNNVLNDEQFAKEVSGIKSIQTVKRLYPNASPQEQEQILQDMHRTDTKADLLKGSSTVEQLNGAYGSNPRIQDVGGGYQPAQEYNGAIRATGPVVPYGLPRETTTNIPPSKDAQGNTIPGRTAPLGAPQPNSPGLPYGGAPQAPQRPALPTTGPMANPSAPIVPTRVPTTQAPTLPSNLRPPNVGEAGSNAKRVSTGHAQFPAPVIGSAPFGQREAAEITGKSSAEMLARARESASNFTERTFPLAQAIPIMERLGTKGTGPGTETINHVKSFLLSNLPGFTDKLWNEENISDVDKVNKYMTQYVRQNGDTGTNDKLAAAFAGNPSIHISNAAATDVLKSAYALERMKKAQLSEFEKTGLPDEQFSRWAGQWQNQQDARAYGTDLMTKEKRDKMIKSMTPKEHEIYKKSQGIAYRAGLIGKPSNE